MTSVPTILRNHLTDLSQYDQAKCGKASLRKIKSNQRREEVKAIFVSEFVDESPRSHAFTKRVRSLAREVSRHGYSIEVLSPQPMKLVATNGDLTESASSLSMLMPPPHGNYLTRIISKVLFFFSLIRILRRERPKCVVVSFHSPLIGLLSTIAGKIASDGVVFDSHDSWIILSQTHPGEARNIVRRRLERLSFRIANVITTVSPTLRQLFVQRYHIDQKKVSIVYSGGDQPVKPVLAAKDIDVIHLGSPRIYYDTFALIEALGIVVRSARNLKVVFLGSMDDAYVREIKEKAKSLGLEDHIRFEPPVPPSEVGNWLARSRVGVHTMARNPEYSSALGLKFFEYLSYGLPVAYLGPSDSEVYKAVATRGLGVTATNIQEFAEKLTELVLDEGKRLTLAERARQMATEFSWEKSGKKMAEILSAL